jgi:hypothetical protein
MVWESLYLPCFVRGRLESVVLVVVSKGIFWLKPWLFSRNREGREDIQSIEKSQRKITL